MILTQDIDSNIKETTKLLELQGITNDNQSEFDEHVSDNHNKATMLLNVLKC